MIAYDADVVIVGSGVAGVSAALALHQAGRQVIMFGSSGASALSGGAWDIATDVLAQPAQVLTNTLPLTQRVHQIVRSMPWHPYARLGPDIIDRLRLSHDLLFQALDCYHGIDWEGPGFLVATDWGTLRRTDAMLHQVHNLTPHVGQPIGVVHPGPSGKHLAAMLCEFSQNAGVDWEFTPDPMATNRLVHMTLLEQSRSHTEGTWLCAKDLYLGMLLEKKLLQMMQFLEFPVHPEQVIRVNVGKSEVSVQLAEGSIVRSRAVILATGRGLTGGLKLKKGLWSEPLVQLPAFFRGQPIALAPSAYGPDPLHQFGSQIGQKADGFAIGVGFDMSCRALGLQGEPVSERLFVAGALLEGTDPNTDGTGLGVAVLSGFTAGQASALI